MSRELLPDLDRSEGEKRRQRRIGNLGAEPQLDEVESKKKGKRRHDRSVKTEKWSASHPDSDPDREREALRRLRCLEQRDHDEQSVEKRDADIVPEFVRVTDPLMSFGIMDRDFDFTNRDPLPEEANHHFDFEIKPLRVKPQGLKGKERVHAKTALRIGDKRVGLKLDPEIGEFASEFADLRNGGTFHAAIPDHKIPGMLFGSFHKFGDFGSKVLAVSVQGEQMSVILRDAFPDRGLQSDPFSLVLFKPKDLESSALEVFRELGEESPDGNFRTVLDDQNRKLRQTETVFHD